MGDETVQQYHANGYTVMRELFSPTTIDQLRSDMLQCFKQVADPPENKDEDAHQSELTLLQHLFEKKFPAYIGAAKVCNHLPALYQLAVSECVLGTLRKLGVSIPALAARPLVWFHHPSLAISSNYSKLPAHQEWSNMQGSLTGAVIWSSLVPIDISIGPLEVIPGSHQMGLAQVAGQKNPNYPLAIDAILDDDRFIPVVIQPGDALIFHPLLIHRSGVNTTNRIRWTFNFRFNNIEDQWFIKRYYPNPFQYQAPTSLPQDEYTSMLLERYNECIDI